MATTPLTVMRQHLEMFQQTFSNALTSDSPRATLPEDILPQLFPHQLAAIDAMQKKEVSLRQGYPVPDKNQVLVSNYAILGDSFGVGKSLMILGHIANMRRFDSVPTRQSMFLHPMSSPSVFSLAFNRNDATYKSLLVVPFALYRQWQEVIDQQTTLSALFLKTQRDLDKESLIQSLENCDITLVSNTLLPHFLNNLRAREVEASWQRVFYDEADTIKITSNCPTPLAHITWFVSVNFMNLFLNNLSYHSFITRQLSDEFIHSLDPIIQEQIQHQIQNHPCVKYFHTESAGFFKHFFSAQHPLRGYLVVRSSASFIQESIPFPPLHRNTIRCQAPLRNRLIENALPAEIQELLHAGDINGALQKLGVTSHTPLTLIEEVMKKTGNTNEKELERIKDLSKDSCAICFDSPSLPCVTPCCSRSFCASCILEWMARVPSCPLCREVFHPNSLLRLSDSYKPGNPESKPTLPKKIDALLQIFNDYPQGQFVLFSKFENTFFTLENALQNRFPMAVLQGNKDVIANLLEDFQSGHLRLLMIQSKQASAGLTITGATHVIFMHKNSADEENQILSRVYRLGRKEPLHCISLLHERE